jgi:hypothetical protein
MGSFADVAPKPPEGNGVVLTKAPKLFEGECVYCHAEFTYPYTAVTSKRGGSSSRGPVTHYGFNCPSCKNWYHHQNHK